jgi:hypothetical protein
MLEVFDNSIIVIWAQKMLKLCQYIFILSWVEFHILFALKILNLEKEFLEIFSAWHSININSEKCFNSLKTFCKFAHCSIMDWITL